MIHSTKAKSIQFTVIKVALLVHHLHESLVRRRVEDLVLRGGLVELRRPAALEVGRVGQDGLRGLR